MSLFLLFLPWSSIFLGAESLIVVPTTIGSPFPSSLLVSTRFSTQFVQPKLVPRTAKIPSFLVSSTTLPVAASSSSSSILNSASNDANDNDSRLLSPREQANMLVRNGMTAFRNGRVDESIRLFDQAEAIQGSSLTPYLWQRGLSYYYANDFDKASRQFRIDVQVNPYDVEEIVWDIASQLRRQNEQRGQEDGDDQTFPIPNQLSLPAGSKDRRKIMSTVYKLFRGEGTEQDLAKAGHDAGVGSPDEFYALYYLGLYCEARGTMSKAEAYLRQASQTRYAQLSNDYMASCAKVHCKLRGWT